MSEPEQPPQSFNPAADLAHIRRLIDQQTKFLSLSGLSGIASGLVALAGAAVAFWYLQAAGVASGVRLVRFSGNPSHFYTLGALALGVFLLALVAAWFFSERLARRKGLTRVWNATSQRLLLNLSLPLAVGGTFCGILLHYQLVFLVAPATLIFYGLGLISASKYTLHEIRYLGLCECALGLVAALIPGYGLLFWAIGFGVLHIAYGLFMYQKYEAR